MNLAQIVSTNDIYVEIGGKFYWKDFAISDPRWDCKMIMARLSAQLTWQSSYFYGNNDNGPAQLTWQNNKDAQLTRSRESLLQLNLWQHTVLKKWKMSKKWLWHRDFWSCWICWYWKCLSHIEKKVHSINEFLSNNVHKWHLETGGNLVAKTLSSLTLAEIAKW